MVHDARKVRVDVLGAERMVIVLVVLVDDETLEVLLIQKLHIGNVSTGTNDRMLANSAKALDVRKARERSVGSYSIPDSSAEALTTSVSLSISRPLDTIASTVGDSKESQELAVCYTILRKAHHHIPRLSAAITTPSLNFIAITEVPVTIGLWVC